MAPTFTECACGFTCGTEAAFEKHLSFAKGDGAQHRARYSGNVPFTLMQELSKAVERALDDKQVYIKSLEKCRSLRRRLAQRSGTHELTDSLQAAFGELAGEDDLSHELKLLRQENHMIKQEGTEQCRQLTKFHRQMFPGRKQSLSTDAKKPSPGKMLVSMISATGLKNLNYSGDDIWCQCDVTRSDHKAQASSCKTGTQRSLMPTWNETYEIPWAEGEDVTFSIYDKGLMGSRMEGKVKVPSTSFYPNGFEGELAITDVPGAILKVRLVPFVYLDLDIKVIGAKKLRNADRGMFGKSDPYVVCNIVSVNGKRNAFTTKVIKNNLDPTWDHHQMMKNIVPGESIEFTVWDKDTFPKPDTLLGMVLVHEEQFHVQGGFRRQLELADPKVSHSEATLSIELVPETLAALRPPMDSDDLDNEARGKWMSLKSNLQVDNGIWEPGTDANELREPSPGMIVVSIVSATGLKNMNFSGDDLWCQCDVTRADHKAQASRCKTAAQRSLMPTWNETHEIPWAEGEPLTFSIYDKGLMKSKVEGKVTVPSAKFYPNGFDGELEISGVPGALLTVRILPFVYLDLKLKVVGANKLRNADHGVFGKSDPYVVCNIVSSAGKRKAFTTPVIKNNLDPIWNHSDLLKNMVPGESLEFTVWDKDNWPKTDDLLGMVMMSQDKFNVPGGFCGELKLADPEVANSEATLSVEAVPC